MPGRDQATIFRGRHFLSGAGAGVVLNTLNSSRIDGSSTTYDFEAAPEPATWSLFAIGAALVGLARRYRK